MTEQDAPGEVLVAASGITKTFPGTVALDRVDFEVRRGEIHALLGANGAGKTTLMMILSGVYRPDEGHVMIGGREVRLQDPHHAQQLGIGTVFQELSLVPGLSIAENLLLGRLPASPLRLIDWDAVRRQAAGLLSRVGLDVDPATPVRVLPPAVRQLVEIAKALAHEPTILLFDEPTAALAGDEIERLFGIMRDLRASGLGVVFITHRVREVFRVADRITILRDGRRVGTFPTASVTPDYVVSLMVGHELPPEVQEERRKTGEPLLEVVDLFAPGLAGVTFRVQRGEILGITGMPGSGREALGRVLFGLARWDRGRVALDGRRLGPLSPVEAIGHGIGYIPSDRKSAGLFLRMSVRDNIIVTRLGDVSRFGVMRWSAAAAMAREFVDVLRIRATSVAQPVGDLSGGTQQKVLVARWLAVRPTLLIAEDPTVGIDVATRVEIHSLLRRLAAQGSAVLLITSDLPEALTVADRILVLAEGRVVAERTPADTSEEELLALAAAPVERVARG
jgi:ribose transport system ATP-binding protein